jgi:hypothetical protein
MSNGEPPATSGPMDDADGDGLPNIAEATIDSSARYQARVALITAVVALVSALLGPLVSLKINSDQIESQGNQATAQIRANTTQSESEFVRTQRSTAYTDFLTAFNNGTLDLLGAAGAFRTPGNSAKALAGQEQAAVQAVKDVTATYYKVRIVASKDANKKAQALYSEFATWSGALLVTGSAVASGTPLTADQQQLLDNGENEYGVLLNLSIDFIDSSRDDVSAND